MRRCIYCKRVLTTTEEYYYGGTCEYCESNIADYLRNDLNYPIWLFKIICRIKRLFRRKSNE